MQELITRLNDLPTGTLEVRSADAEQTTDEAPICGCATCNCLN